jgi:hypothetical protein
MQEIDKNQITQMLLQAFQPEKAAGMKPSFKLNSVGIRAEVITSGLRMDAWMEEKVRRKNLI